MAPLSTIAVIFELLISDAHVRRPYSNIGAVFAITLFNFLVPHTIFQYFDTECSFMIGAMNALNCGVKLSRTSLNVLGHVFSFAVMFARAPAMRCPITLSISHINRSLSLSPLSFALVYRNFWCTSTLNYCF